MELAPTVAGRRLQNTSVPTGSPTPFPTPFPTPCPNGTVLSNGTCANITIPIPCKNVSVPETKFMDECIDGDTLMATLVYRSAPKPCIVDVETAETNTTTEVMVPNMSLVQSSLDEGAPYFTEDNQTRLVWRMNPGDFCEEGWSLEMNMAVEYEMLANCSDNADVAN